MHNLRVFFTCFVILIRVSALTIPSLLNLNVDLYHFQECTVHVLHVNHLDKNTDYIQPVIVPHVITRPRYAQIYTNQSYFIKDIHLKCGRKSYRLIDKAGFKINSFISRRLNCEVSLYISPWMHCRSWSFGGSHLEDETGQPMLWWSHNVLTNSASDLSVPAILREGHAKLFKGHSYFLFVGSIQSAELPFKQNIIYAVEAKRETGRAILNVVRRKIIFLQVSKARVVSRYLVASDHSLEEIASIKKQNAEFADLPSNWDVKDYFEKGKANSLLNMRYTLTKCENVSMTHIKFNCLLHTLQNKLSNFNKNSVMTVECYTNKCNEVNNGNTEQIRKWFTTNREIPVEKTYLKYLFSNYTLLVGIIETDFIRQHGLFPEFSVKETLERPEFVSLESKGFHFVVCSNITQSNSASLIAIFDAYDFSTWVCLFVTMLLFAAIITRIETRNPFRISFKCLWLLFSALLEQSDERLANKKYRVIFCTWILLAVVITNGYRGDNIKRLSAPLPPSRLDTFNKLLNQQDFLFVPQFPNILQLLAQMSTAHFQGLDEIIKLTWQEMNPINLAYFNKSTIINATVVTQVLSNTLQINSLLELKEMYQPDSISRRVAECANYAFIGSYSSAFPFYVHLRKRLAHKREMVTISQDSLGPTTRYWEFEKLDVELDDVLTKVRSLVHSGIVQMWEEWDLRVATWNATITEAQDYRHPVKRLAMKDNIRVIFFLYCALFALASIGFVVEIRMHLWLIIFYVVITVILQLKQFQSWVINFWRGQVSYIVGMRERVLNYFNRS